MWCCAQMARWALMGRSEELPIQHPCCWTRFTMAMVKRVQQQGCWIGSSSDRPMSAQRAIWAQHHIAIDFAVGKLMLPDVKAKFVADVYYHIGDREDLDRKYALEAGFAFLWPHEALVQPWFL